MKKLLFVGALALAGAMNAQKNTLLVGGSMDYTSAKTSISGVSGDSTSDSFEFAPTVGYQFSDNWTAGINAAFLNTKTEISGVTAKYDQTRVGAFVRYAKPLSDLFSVYGDLGAGFQTGKSSGVKANGMYVQFTPALFINMKNGFGLNFNIGGIGYETAKTDTNPEVKVNGFNVNFGKTVGIGISKNFKL